MEKKNSKNFKHFAAALILSLIAFNFLSSPVLAANMNKVVAQAAKVSVFKSEVLDSKVPVLVDFWAPWCGPCRVYGPILEKAAKSYGAKVKVVRYDVDKNPDLAKIFDLDSIPATYFFNKGKVIKSWVGVVEEPQLRAAIDKVLKK